MSRYNLTINGNIYDVEVTGFTGAAASVTVNGNPYQVQLSGGAVTSAVPVAPAAAPAAPAPAQPAAAAPAPAQPAPAAPAAPEGGEVVAAPMPGLVLSVMVKEGDTVSEGDTIIVIEAMKMENEIKAHVSGTVTKVNVAPGTEISVNDVMVVIGG